MKKIGAYAGLTGITSSREARMCSHIFQSAVACVGRYVAENLNFMQGVLVSSKTLVGGTNKWPNRYPPIDSIPDIFSMDWPRVLRTIHYNTDDPSTLVEQVHQVIDIAPSSIDALQLNMRWPSPIMLQRINRNHPHLRIILQIGASALADVDEPGEIFLGKALKDYEGVVDDFLVDPSGGKGEPLDIWRAFACLADDQIPASMRSGWAGGFRADNVYKTRGPMRRLKRPVNIDAEGGVRTPKVIHTDQKEGADLGDHLDLQKASAYLGKAVAFVGEAMMCYEAN